MSFTTRILAIGDLHIQPDTLAEINVFLSQLEKWLKQNPVDLIVILGDTLHTHETIYTECLNKALEYIQICEKYAQTEVLVGNHDLINNQQFLTSLHPFTGWKKSHNIVDFVKIVEINKKKITLSPFVPDGRFHEALRTVGEEWKDSACIFAHQLFDGAKMGPIVANGIEKWDEDYPMLISGHIHDKQRVQSNLWYTGSSMQISFGEREDHTLTLVQITDDKIDIQEVNIFPPVKKTVYCDISKISETKIPTEENVKVKISVSGDNTEFKTFKKTLEYQKLIQSGVKIVFKQKKNVIVGAPSTNLKNFPDILFSLLEDDIGMMDMYNQVIGYKEICFE